MAYLPQENCDYPPLSAAARETVRAIIARVEARLAADEAVPAKATDLETERIAA
jgi:hypothetical protein